MTTLRRTNRWRGVAAVALLAVAGGLLSTRPEVLLLAILGVGYAVYPRLISAPPVDPIELERSLSDTSPSLEEDVTVRLTIRNTSDDWLHDVRVVDGVPSLLPVVGDTPRIATALSPGGEETLEYTIQAVQGKHRFGPATVILRCVSGGSERTTTVETPTVLNCVAHTSEAPVLERTRETPGPIPTDAPGQGIEFHRTREYHPGEPLDRIDWRRFARTGDLTSVDFRPDRSASVVLCLDTTGGPVERSLAAADRLAHTLLARSHAVGLAALGDDTVWMRPRSGRLQADALEDMLDTAPAFAIGGDTQRTEFDGDPAIAARPAATDGGKAPGLGLFDQLGPRDQVLFISPLLGASAVRTPLALAETDDRVLVVSPAVRPSDGLGGTLVSLSRAAHIRRLRSAGIPVIDWNDDSLETTVLQWMERAS